MSNLRLYFMFALLLPEVCGCGRDPAADESTDRPTERTLPLKAPSGNWQVGTHYELLNPTERLSVPSEKVRVLEFFWYGCAHCYELEPHLLGWSARKPAYVEFLQVPSQGRPASKSHARLYYTLRALGRQDLHARAFEAIHERGLPLYADNNDETLRLQMQFAVAHGVAAESFLKAIRSAEVDAAMKQADELARRYKVISVPTIVVNDRYLTSLGRAETPANLIAMVTEFTEREGRR